MTDEHTDVPPPSTGPADPPVSRSARLEHRIEIATVVGCLLAGAGVIAGIVRVAGRREGECPDGKTWPKGETDFICYVHPHAFEGAAFIVTALLLGILIGLVGFVAQAVVARDRAEINRAAREG